MLRIHKEAQGNYKDVWINMLKIPKETLLDSLEDVWIKMPHKLIEEMKISVNFEIGLEDLVLYPSEYYSKHMAFMKKKY